MSEQQKKQANIATASMGVPRAPVPNPGMAISAPSPNVFQRFLSSLNNTMNNPALMESILGPNQMLQIQDQKLDPNLVLGRNISAPSNAMQQRLSGGASGSWTPMIDLRNSSPKNQISLAEKFKGMHKLREMAPE